MILPPAGLIRFTYVYIILSSQNRHVSAQLSHPLLVFQTKYLMSSQVRGRNASVTKLARFQVLEFTVGHSIYIKRFQFKVLRF